MDEVLDTKVIVPGATRAIGILKYVGAIEGKNGVFGGLELQGPVAASRGKNNGSVNGIQYFSVSQPMSGLFLPWERLKAANPHLQRADLGELSRSSSSITSSREKSFSPLPRDKALLRLNGDSVSRAQSPVSLQNQLFSTLSTRKRDGVSFFSEGLGKAPSRTSSQSSDVRVSDEIDSLRREVSELKDTIKIKTMELRERNDILAGLQSTIKEIQPLLEEYERDIEIKDSKLSKHKADFDRAREEWRESLLLMVAAQQETESLYERQIEDLKCQLQKSYGGDDDSLVDLKDLQSKMEELQKENESLKSPPTSGSDDVDDALNSQQQLKLPDQDVLLLEQSLQTAEEDLKAKELRIKELESKLEEMSNREVESVSQTMKGMDINSDDQKKKIEELSNEISEQKDENKKLQSQIQELDLQSKKLKAELIKKDEEIFKLQKDIKEVASSTKDTLLIEELQHQLKMRPTFEELTELQTSLEELDTLHQKEVDSKDKLIKHLTIESKLSSLEVQRLKSQIEEFKKQMRTPEPNGGVFPLNLPSVVSGGSLPEPEAWARSDGLDVYVPANPIDPSSGRQNWCGLCERDGHNSLNCPYENDIF